MSDDPKKPSENPLRSFVKATVDTANTALASLEQASKGVRQPVGSSLKTLGEQSSVVGGKVKYVYQRRHEFAPQLIAGSAVLGGGMMALRRGRIAGLVGAVGTGGLAYAVVYDQVNMDHLPDIIFGKKS
jgi:hypothetical protein